MIFTKIKSGNDCESYSIYAYGTVGEIASLLRDESECAMAIESDWTVEDFEEDSWYSGDFDDYKQLINGGDSVVDVIRNYHFSLEDMYTDVVEFISAPEEIEKKLSEVLAGSGYRLDASTPDEKAEALMDIFDQEDEDDTGRLTFSKIRHVKRV